MKKVPGTFSGGPAALVVAALLAWPAASAAVDAAHQQFLFAYKLLQRGDEALAAEAFDRFLGDFPGDERAGDAAYYRALLHRRTGDARRAAGVLADAPPPGLVPIHALRLLQGQVLIDLGLHADALTPLEAIDARELPPRSAATTRYLRGLTYRAVGNLDAAAADLAACAELDTPLRERSRLELARVEVLRGNAEQARATLDAVLASSDRGVEAEAARLAGELAYRAGDHDAAVSLFGRVVERHQSSTHFGPAVVGAMWAHAGAGRPERVLELFDRHAEAMPMQDRLPATYLRGSALLELERYDGAEATLAGIARGEYPLLEQVLYKLAVARHELGRYEEARVALSRLARAFPDSPRLADAAFLLAVIDAEAGRVDRGAARLSELIEQGSDHPYHRQALLRRARLYERHGRPGPAINDYRAFLAGVEAWDGQATAASLRLADLALRAGEPALAAEVTAAALSRPGLDADARQEAMFRRALALTRLGRLADAAAQLDALDEAYPLGPYAAESTYVRGLIAARGDDPGAAVEPLRAAGFDASLAVPQRVNSLRLLALLQREASPDAAEAALVELAAVAGPSAWEPGERLWLAARRLAAGEGGRAAALVEPIIQDAERGPVLAEALLVHGRALRAEGELDRAERSLDAVLALGEGFDFDAMAERAAISGDRGDHARAIAMRVPLTTSESSRVAAEALLATAASHRALADAADPRGDAAAYAEHLADAARVLKRLVILYPFAELSPLPERAYLDLAEVELARGDADAAERELNEMLSAFGGGSHATVARAMLDELRPPFGRGLAALRGLDRASLGEPLAERVDRLIARWEAR